MDLRTSTSSLGTSVSTTAAGSSSSNIAPPASDANAGELRQALENSKTIVSQQHQQLLTERRKVGQLETDLEKYKMALMIYRQRAGNSSPPPFMDHDDHSPFGAFQLDVGHQSRLEDELQRQQVLTNQLTEREVQLSENCEALANEAERLQDLLNQQEHKLELADDEFKKLNEQLDHERVGNKQLLHQHQEFVEQVQQQLSVPRSDRETMADLLTERDQSNDEVKITRDDVISLNRAMNSQTEQLKEYAQRVVDLEAELDLARQEQQLVNVAPSGSDRSFLLNEEFRAMQDDWQRVKEEMQAENERLTSELDEKMQTVDRLELETRNQRRNLDEAQQELLGHKQLLEEQQKQQELKREPSPRVIEIRRAEPVLHNRKDPILDDLRRELQQWRDYTEGLASLVKQHAPAFDRDPASITRDNVQPPLEFASDQERRWYEYAIHLLELAIKYTPERLQAHDRQLWNKRQDDIETVRQRDIQAQHQLHLETKRQRELEKMSRDHAQIQTPPQKQIQPQQAPQHLVQTQQSVQPVDLYGVGGGEFTFVSVSKDQSNGNWHSGDWRGRDYPDHYNNPNRRPANTLTRASVDLLSDPVFDYPEKQNKSLSRLRK